MKRMNPKTAQLRKRVKAVQGKAKFAGILYLLGTIALGALVALFPVLTGGTTEITLSALKFYKPLQDLFANGFAGLKSLTVAQMVGASIALLYAFMLLGMAINILRAIAKLGWLFKRRASYTNGFNRNMYAMDDMGKRFSGSLAAMVIFNVFIYLLLGEGAKITMLGYIILGGGLAWHLFVGAIGGTVTVFTMGDHIEEEEREHGVFVYVIRNVLQLVATATILYFIIPQSVLVTKIEEVLQALVVDKAGFGALELKGLVPAGVELVAWICICVLIKHATGSTEFNRDCMDGAGMRNFTVFAFFTFLALGALAVLPYLGIGVVEGAEKLNVKIVVATGIAFVAFLLDCIVKSGARGAYDDLDMETYFKNDSGRYNNTII